MKLTNNAVLLILSELIHWSCLGGLLFKMRDSIFIQCSLDDDVNNVTCAADSVLVIRLMMNDYLLMCWMFLAVVRRVVAHKSVNVRLKIVLSDDVEEK